MFADIIDLKKLRLALIYILTLLILLFFQDTVFARLGLLGVKMLFIPAACVAVSLFEGGFRGGLFGLLAGVLCDLAFPENTLLSIGPGVGILAEPELHGLSDHGGGGIAVYGPGPDGAGGPGGAWVCGGVPDHGAGANGVVHAHGRGVLRIDALDPQKMEGVMFPERKSE